jgi:hypothetical protein
MDDSDAFIFRFFIRAVNRDLYVTAAFETNETTTTFT